MKVTLSKDKKFIELNLESKRYVFSKKVTKTLINKLEVALAEMDKKRCPRCWAQTVETFDSNNDWCTTCQEYFPAE